MMYLEESKNSERAYVPTSTLIEFDLVMRNHGYTEDEISDTWRALSPLVQKFELTDMRQTDAGNR
jgi:hypothetical protein